MTLLARFGTLAAVCVLSGCSDGAETGDPMSSTSGAGGAGTGGALVAGSSGSSTQGGSSAGMTTQGGGGSTAGGVSGGSAGVGGMSGSAGMGGMAIDPNGGAPTGPASGRHTARPIGSMPGIGQGYYEYLPPHYGNGAHYPLLVFRHGIGENGNGTTDLAKVLVHGPPKHIENDTWPESRPFVVLSVQHTGDGCSTSAEIDDFIAFAKDTYDIDPQRVYLTGLSCGAIGSWSYLGDHVNEDVAAAVLICGDARSAWQKQMCNLGKVPIWAFHGDKDPTVLPEYQQVPIASLEQCTSPAPVDVKLTIYPGVQHDSWTMTYDLSNPQNDIYAWMLSHTKQ
jgi:dienelactone hydrolase